MSRYEPLIALLKSIDVDEKKLSFAEVEEIIEGQLPDSARQYRAWWANSKSSKTHTWANLWMNAGWITREVNFSDEYVVFSKIERIKKYWWVNHNKSHKEEIGRNYIWSPRAEKNGRKSQFYLNLTRVKPGDVVFSYANSKIMAIGVVSDFFRECDKPIEFGKIENTWDKNGWLVPITWTKLDEPFSPKQHIEKIRDHLNDHLSPINKLGEGSMKCYLANISESLASVLFDLAKTKVEVPDINSVDIEVEIAEQAEESKINSSNLKETEKQQLIKARLGQGIFRQNLINIEKKCRVTGVTNLSFLIASHIKPWRASDNKERLDGENGLLLAPHIDKLFDRGWISFSDEGDMLIYSDAINTVLEAWKVEPGLNISKLSENQKKYLAYHRQEIFGSNKLA